MRIYRHTDGAKTDIGYVCISIQEQDTEGVSLGAQRDKLSAYCKINAIEIIDIKGDEGCSGRMLERPALPAALQMIRRGHVDRRDAGSLVSLGARCLHAGRGMVQR